LPANAVTRAPERAKKVNNNDLPSGIDQKLWRPAFISTYMQFVASQPNPWELPVKLACEKLQLIWDAIFPGTDYIVTSTSAAYLLVSMLGYAVQFIFIDAFCRLFNGPQTHGVMPLGQLHLQFCLHTLSLMTAYGILMRIESNLPSMHLMSSGSATRRPAVMTPM
jgi:hypothetical protein